MSDDTPTITQQYSFAASEDGEIGGEIEPNEESVETSLEAFGADVDHRERDSRIYQPEATSFGVDDRPEATSADAGEQGSLFADTKDDQQTLTGERAASQCLFGDDAPSDESDDNPETDTSNTDRTKEPTMNTSADDETPRAVADGGRVKDEDDTNNREEDDTDSEDSDDADPTFDADEETVTDAWEGAFISASWGYGQTNVELAQIVEVSESGKTVLARFVTAERVDHGRTSEQLRPTANQYGDEFRLHVRDGIKDDPRFRGSYPLSNDGDMDDGPTRRGSFYPFDNSPENSIHQTATNHGH